MGLFNSSKPAAEPKEQWIPYRENGEVKYMRAEEAQGTGPTGGATTHRKTSAWANMGGEGITANAPQLLPERYTDDSVLPYILTDIIPAMEKPSDAEPKKSGFKRFLNQARSKEDPSIKAVYMPRGEYKKYFAKDKDGKYIGTEPQRSWTAEELDEEFGQYQK
jgi:hypothetical protein